MITTEGIINEVNKLLYQKHGYQCHIQNIPQGFKRPCFFIELVTDGSDDVNKVTTEEDVSIQIVYFAPVNKYNIVDGADQLRMYSELKNLFRKGYFQVEDRTIKITSIMGAPRGNEIYLSVTFQYFEERPEDTETYETMQELYLK